jgi:nucleotide-binding universal stress UspA family protein
MGSSTVTKPHKRYVILAALSFDETGATALQEAVRLAEFNPEADLHVVHVYGEDFEQTRHGELVSSEQQRVSAPDTLRRYVDEAVVETTCKVTGHIRAGAAAPEILQAAAELDADVVVLGSHQSGGTGRLMLRHVAESVMRGASCPVLIAVAKRPSVQRMASEIEPVCPDCLLSRNRAHDPSEWCERHLRPRDRFHVYTPSELSPRLSVMGS